ncbi:MAG TPA: universal stress protein, partial [Nitrososphaera sp.]|nr:universal stress protein [Nitrososphaera sp.]
LSDHISDTIIEFAKNENVNLIVIGNVGPGRHIQDKDAWQCLKKRERKGPLPGNDHPQITVHN